jgi:protoporphyrinogen/coproporphyrinogen III oxidase
MKDAIIIGGGVTGLTTGYRLVHEHGLDAVVLEKEKNAGGKARTELQEGFTTEMGTNGWLDKEPAMGALIQDLGKTDLIQTSDESASHRYIFRSGYLQELYMHPLKFMTSSALPIGARLRVALEPFIAKRTDESDETLADFADRRLGRVARELLIGPMASGVYAGDPSRMSLRSCFAKVHALENNYGGLIKGMIALKKEKRARGEDPNSVQAGPSGRLTSMKGGVQDLIDALVESLRERLLTGVSVASIHKKEDGFAVHDQNGEIFEAKTVISAAPAWAAAQYLSSLDHDAADAFQQIPYPSLDVVCLGFPKSAVPRNLFGFGFLVPRNQGVTILGSLWTSSIFPGRAPEGYVLLRNMIGGMLNPEVADWDEEKVVRTVRKELDTILGIDGNQKPTFQKIFRHPRAIPQYHVGHSELKRRIQHAEKRHPGFFASGNAIKGIGMIDCVRESNDTAKSVSDFIKCLSE